MRKEWEGWGGGVRERGGHTQFCIPQGAFRRNSHSGATRTRSNPLRPAAGAEATGGGGVAARTSGNSGAVRVAGGDRRGLRRVPQAPEPSARVYPTLSPHPPSYPPIHAAPPPIPWPFHGNLLTGRSLPENWPRREPGRGPRDMSRCRARGRTCFLH